MSHYLTTDTFCAAHEDQHIFLHVGQNRYFALGAAKIAECLPFLSPNGPVLSTKLPEILVEMERRGLFTRDKKQAKAFSPTVHVPPARSLAEDEGDEAAPLEVSIHDTAQFARAMATAFASLKFGTLRSTINRVAQRRPRRLDSDINSYRHAMNVFATLQTLTPSQWQCYQQSLLALEFLHRKGLHPKWVFGVRFKPFSAHCWLEDAGTILNDTTHNVRLYTPIMVV